MATVESGLSGHILAKGSRLLHCLWCPAFVLTIVSANLVHVNSLVSFVETNLMCDRIASEGLQACGCCRLCHARVVLYLWKDRQFSSVPWVAINILHVP